MGLILTPHTFSSRTFWSIMCYVYGISLSCANSLHLLCSHVLRVSYSRLLALKTELVGVTRRLLVHWGRAKAPSCIWPQLMSSSSRMGLCLWTPSLCSFMNSATPALCNKETVARQEDEDEGKTEKTLNAWRRFDRILNNRNERIESKWEVWVHNMFVCVVNVSVHVHPPTILHCNSHGGNMTSKLKLNRPQIWQNLREGQFT